MTEYRLIASGGKVTLAELMPGTIFLYGDDCIAVKSEYRCSNGLIEAFIIDSGEQFWGGAHTVREQHELVVQPMEVVEAVHGRWVPVIEHGWIKREYYVCSKCMSINRTGIAFNYCFNCGAKMDAKEEQQ